MSHRNQRKHAFYVVQFVERPFEGVDDYVCVPVDWLVVYFEKNQTGAVAYPTDEDPFDTRDRARRRERHDDKWRYYMVDVKYESDSYSEAESWIATRNDYGPLAEEELNMNTQRRSTLNRALPSADRNRAAATNVNPREPQATNDNPREPQATNDNPREPQATNDNPREPQATNDNPREPQATNVNPREPQATNDNPREPQATNDNPREPQATNDNPREPQATNDNPRKPTPRPAFKRPALLPNANKGRGKRSKPSKTAQSSASSKPGCSREQVIIIHDDEPIAPAQARVIASNGDSRSSQSINGNPQQLSIPAIDVDMPTSVIQRKKRRTSITNQIQETSIDNSNKSISHNVLDSLKISDHLYRDMNRARRLVPIGPPVEKRLSFMNTERTKAVPSAVAAQNPSSLLDRIESLWTPSIEERSLITQNGMAISPEEIKQEADIDVERPHEATAEQPRGLVQGVNSIASAAQNVPSSNQDSSSVREVDGQRGSPILEQHITHSRQNQCVPMERNSFERNPLRLSTESNDNEHLPNSPTICMGIPLTGQNPPNPSIPSNQTRETPQQRQSQPNQPPLQPQEPNVCMSTFRRILDSLRQALREGDFVHQQLSETSPNERELIESRMNVHKACQTDNSKAAERLSRPDAVSSGPSARADHGTAYGSSTDDQTYSRHVPDQRMLDNLAAHNQMLSTSRTTCDVSYNLRGSILKKPETYTNLLDTVQRFNTMTDVPLEVPVTEERLEGSARHGSRNGNGQVNNVADNTQNKKHDNSRRSPVGAINNAGTASGSSIDDQTHSRHVLEQQMFDNFAALFNQMHSTLRATSVMFKDLQSSILKGVRTYKNLRGAVEAFNTVVGGVPVTQERIESSARHHGCRIEIDGSSSDDQTHSRHVLEQLILDKFKTLFTQMHFTSGVARDMSNTLRDSALETARTYKILLDSVETVNTVRNSASSASTTNVSIKDPLVTEGRLASSKHGSRSGNEQGNNEQKKKHNNLGRLVLPPEYDRDDTRWTLKYREKMLGLVEMTPESRVYVDCGDLKYCLQVSKDCKSLARRLLPVVFNRNALSVCLTMAERAKASDNVDDNARPELDDHAKSVLLKFVLEYGLQRGWNTDLRPILNTIDSKMKEIRFKYGVRVQAN